MKGPWLLMILFFLAAQIYCWDKHDYEIFDLVNELEAIEGKGVSFYSFLDVKPTASMTEIGKAYRKKNFRKNGGLLLHPDKNPGVKNAHERFTTLGVIASILRNQERRERYDFFYKNGVPRWRGTGYYYSRFRPGLGTVLVFLVMFTSALQYLVQSINYRSDLNRIERFIAKARLAAWGPKLQLVEGKRKVKIRGDAHNEEDPNAKWIEMVVDGNEVFIIDVDGQLLPLNASVAKPAAVTRTWFIDLARLLYQRVRRASQGSNEVYQNQIEKSEDGDAEPEARDSINLKGPKRALQGSDSKSTITPKASRTGVRRR